MSIPKPAPGMVFHYDYLWRHESLRGAESGTKSRPCAIIVAVAGAAQVTEVVAAPISHAPPASSADGIEIPPMIKRHLGLDDQRSWIITTDLNVFIWPGPDLLPIPNRTPRSFTYGFLPPRFFESVRRQVVAAMATRPATRRTE